MSGRRATRGQRAEPVGASPPPATEPRRAQPGPVRVHRAQMVNPLDAVAPAYDHHMVPGRGWVPDRKA